MKQLTHAFVAAAICVLLFLCAVAVILSLILFWKQYLELFASVLILGWMIVLYRGFVHHDWPKFNLQDDPTT